MSFVVAAFYKFTRFPQPQATQAKLKAAFAGVDSLRGTVLVAAEGLNGTIAATPEDCTASVNILRSLPGCNDLEVKYSEAEAQPFLRLKIRLKKEIVTIGDPAVDPNARVGTYVKPDQWNALIEDPEVVLIDCRNDYEVEIGSFKGAVDPKTKSFRDFPAYIEQNFSPETTPKVAMFCTGGIRCEKASSFMLQQGFGEVYHLEGGILKYLETMPPEQSQWQGDCFVFDGRVAVGQGLEESGLDQCHACRRPIDDAAKAHTDYELGVSCPRCISERTDEDRQRYRSRQKQVELAAQTGRKHLG